MANIDLVIKIDEEQYEFIKENITNYYEVKDYHALLYDICEGIKNGIPLPKGHGDLIDKSNLLTVTDYDGENEKTYVLYEEIEDAQPIIEADTESEV